LTSRVKYVRKYKGNRRVKHWIGSNWPEGNTRVKNTVLTDETWGLPLCIFIPATSSPRLRTCYFQLPLLSIVSTVLLWLSWSDAPLAFKARLPLINCHIILNNLRNTRPAYLHQMLKCIARVKFDSTFTLFFCFWRVLFVWSMILFLSFKGGVVKIMQTTEGGRHRTEVHLEPQSSLLSFG